MEERVSNPIDDDPSMIAKREEMVKYIVEDEYKTGKVKSEQSLPSWFKNNNHYKEFAEAYRKEIGAKYPAKIEEELSEDEQILREIYGDSLPTEEQIAEEKKRVAEIERIQNLKKRAELHIKNDSSNKRVEYNREWYKRKKLIADAGKIPVTSAFEPGESIVCPCCGGIKVNKSGYILKAHEKRQRYLCKTCSYVFSEKI